VSEMEQPQRSRIFDQQLKVVNTRDDPANFAAQGIGLQHPTQPSQTREYANLDACATCPFVGGQVLQQNPLRERTVRIYKNVDGVVQSVGFVAVTSPETTTQDIIAMFDGCNDGPLEVIYTERRFGLLRKSTVHRRCNAMYMVDDGILYTRPGILHAQSD